MLMQPTQQMPNPNTPPPKNQLPTMYDFILSDQSAGRKNKSGGQGKRAGVAVLAGLLVVVAGLFGYNYISNSSSNSAQLIDAKATQTELIRVAALADTKAKLASTKNLAATISINTSSDLQKISDVLVKKKTKVLPTDISKKKNTKTDEVLSAAEPSGSYDAVFNTTILSVLAQYRSSLTSLINATSAKTEKSIYIKMRDKLAVIIASDTVSSL
jgi:hypothetical protein